MLQRNQRMIPAGGIILLILALLNGIILTYAYTNNPQLYWWLVISIPLLLAATYKTRQKKRADYSMPNMRLHFFAQREDGNPFKERANLIVHQAAKSAGRVVAPGMYVNGPTPGSEWEAHSVYPLSTGEEDVRVTIGNNQCSQPYNASILIMEVTGYSLLSNAAVQDLNEGAVPGEFAHNTGEHGISHHYLNGGDLIWQIGPGYFGCRSENGNFNTGKFIENARRPEVKMIELKLSQSATSGYGSIEPTVTDSRQLAGGSINRLPRHTAFSNAEGMLLFIESLRKLSFGKPVGVRLCIENKKQVYELCYYIQKTGIIPDFITVDGFEDATGAVSPEMANEVVMPLYEALTFVSATLQAYGLKEHIKIIAAGKIISGFDVVKAMALGADACCSAGASRFTQTLQSAGSNFSIDAANGQSRRYEILDITDRNVWAANFHKNTIKAVTELMAVCGFKKLSDITVPGFFRLMNFAEIKSASNTYRPHRLRETRKIAF